MGSFPGARLAAGRSRTGGAVLPAAAMAILALAVSLAPAQEIVAHRGASFDAPENTLAAFRLAWKQGADAIEGDFLLTADRRIVCLHDENTERTAGRKLVVAESSLADLRELDVGRWKGKQWAGERIPTLAEVLETVPDGKRLFLEVKCGPEIVPPLVRVLEEHRAGADKIVVISFDAAVVQEIRRVLPGYRANWLCSYRQRTQEWRPSANEVLQTLRDCAASGLGSQANLDVLTPRFLERLKERDLEIHVWTVNTVPEAVRLQRLGVDSITTDRPGFLKRRLRAVVPLEGKIQASRG